jgi:hypothetical protein
MGNREWGMGNRKWGTGNRDVGAGFTDNLWLHSDNLTKPALLDAQGKNKGRMTNDIRPITKNLA